MNNKKRQQIFSRFKNQNPNPKTELIYSNSFQLLVAVVLSAQATDVSVNKATEQLFRLAHTPEDIIKLGHTYLQRQIRSIGLFRTKAKNIMRLCTILIDHYDSHVPSTRDALESLPGVGRKTANVVLNTAFGEPVVAVDTHIFRVANRTGIAKGGNVLEVESKLQKVIPKAFLVNCHHWLILHGRYVCKARKPLCSICLIADLCDYQVTQKIPDPRKPSHKKKR